MLSGKKMKKEFSKPMLDPGKWTHYFFGVGILLFDSALVRALRTCLEIKKKGRIKKL